MFARTLVHLRWSTSVLHRGEWVCPWLWGLLHLMTYYSQMRIIQGQQSVRYGMGENVEESAARVHASAGDARAVLERGARRSRLVLIVSVAVLVVLVCISLMLGRYPISPVDAVKMLVSPFMDIPRTWTDQAQTLFFNVRLPRILLACVVGCGLSATGAAYQGTFQNPLVSSDILGASQGAAFGAACALLAGASSVMVSVTAFAFAMGTVLLVMAVSLRGRGDHVLTVVLVGVMVSSLAQAGVSFAKLVADPTDQLPAITYWLMGSLTSANLRDLAFASAPVGMGLVALHCLRWRINVLTMGDDEARTMGVDARRVRMLVMVSATLVTAACVAVSGMIGWVGLVIPHLCRMVVGSDYRNLLPASMLCGASFLLVVDNISRLAYTAEIPIGILTAFVGAPFFLYLIMRRKRGL